jgi:hypothetical protein
MGKAVPEHVGSETCRDRVTIVVVGLLFVAVAFVSTDLDGGRGAAVCYGLFGSALIYPIFVLLGKLSASLIGRLKPLGAGARNAITLAPALIMLTLMAHDGYRARDPLTKFERRVASPVPPSVRVESAYTYQGFNFTVWAFHFRVSKGDLPAVLARPYVHETDPAGHDLDYERDRASRTPGYPAPPPGFRAVHRYRSHEPTPLSSYDVTLYGDASQTEFYAYGFFE